MPADVEAPDKVLYGLTFRQLAILAVAAVILAVAYHLLHQLVPLPVLLVAAVLLGGLTFGVAVGRRDGLPFDVWLAHGLRFSRAPQALTTIDTAAGTPDWVAAPAARVALPAPLRLPASAIGDDGQISLGGQSAAIVAATTVNLALRTGDEQAALIDTFGRWLNSLTAATQIVVSAQPVDLQSARRHPRRPRPPPAPSGAGRRLRRPRRVPRRPRRTPRSAAPASADHRPHPGRARRPRCPAPRRGHRAGPVWARCQRTKPSTARPPPLSSPSCADPYRPPRAAGLAPPEAVITSTANSQTNRSRR